MDVSACATAIINEFRRSISERRSHADGPLPEFQHTVAALSPQLSPKAARACASTRAHRARVTTSLTCSVLSMGRIARLARLQMHVGNAPAPALEATGDATDI